MCEVSVLVMSTWMSIRSGKLKFKTEYAYFISSSSHFAYSEVALPVSPSEEIVIFFIGEKGQGHQHHEGTAGAEALLKRVCGRER